MASKKPTICGIAVRGFKSIRDLQEIEIRPLTILAGANSSGKSSIIQPLLLLKQTLESPGDPGALLLNGPNVRFTLAEQLLSRCPAKSVQSEFAIRLKLTDKQQLEVVYEREKRVGFKIKTMVYSDGRETTKILPDMPHDEIDKIVPSQVKRFMQEFMKKRKKLQWFISRNRCFLYIEMKETDHLFKRRPYLPGISPSTAFIPHIRNLIHVPGLRGNPERSYPKSAYGPAFPGTFQTYVASIITRWQADQDNLLDQLASALEQMGLTWKVKAERLDDTQVEIKVGRLTHGRVGGAYDLVNVADVGFGLSQSLPVIVALIAAKPGQVVYLEQPEIHLHPLAQRKLAHVISRAAKQGAIIIVETHSSLILREIQTIVAKSDLRKEDVKLHWVQRDKADGATTVRSADLDKDGAFGDWPADFDKVELDADKAYLDAVEERNGQR